MPCLRNLLMRISRKFSTLRYLFQGFLTLTCTVNISFIHAVLSF